MATWRSWFDEYFFTPVAAIRPWLVEKSVLVLLACDMWFGRMRGANRYDAGELSMAHFDWLDRLGPVPTEGLYLGAVALTGILSLVIAIAELGVGWKLGLTLLYTFTWAMSRLDTYQHHYLLTWVLVCIAFFPRVRLADFWQSRTQPDAPRSLQSPLVSAWAWALLCAFAAIVYAYTAIAKLDGVWLSGACLQQLAGPAQVLKPFESLFVALGGSAQSYWSWMAWVTVAVEILIAAGYLLAPWADRQPGSQMRRVFFATWLLAVGLHVSFEVAGLRIGWFSYFMVLLASTTFLPAAALEKLVRFINQDIAATPASKTSWLWTILATLALVATCWWSDLPGVLAASLIAAGALALMWLDLHRREMATNRLPLAICLAAMVATIAVQFGDARAEFYPYRLAQLQRRGDFSTAAAILPKAERYADADDPYAQFNLAWFLAVVPDDSLRSGDKALPFARQVCELTGNENVSALDALACAFAAQGDFEEALSALSRAKQLLDRDGLGSDPVYGELLTHEAEFRQRRPYVEPVRYRYVRTGTESVD